MIEIKRYKNKKSQNNEAPLYIGLCAICHSRDERAQNKKVRIILDCWESKL